MNAYRSEERNMATEKSHVQLKGKCKSGDAMFEATAFCYEKTRTVTIVKAINGHTTRATVFSDAAVNAIYVHAADEHSRRRVALTALGSRDEGAITVWKDDLSDSLSFRYSVPTLVKAKSLKDAILGGKGEHFVQLVGSQPYLALQEEFEPLMAKNADYVRFLEESDPDGAGPPAIPGWCIAIFCVPIIGIAGFAFKRCRG